MPDGKLVEQTPPMYSARKVDGKRLYELARQKGEQLPVEIPEHSANGNEQRDSVRGPLPEPATRG